MIEINYLNEFPKMFSKETSEFKNLFSIFNEMKAQITYVKSTVEIENKSLESLSKNTLAQTKIFTTESSSCEDLTNLIKVEQIFIQMFEQISSDQIMVGNVNFANQTYENISDYINEMTKGSNENISSIIKELNNARTKNKTLYTKTEKSFKDLEVNFQNKKKLENDEKNSFNSSLKDKIDDKILNILKEFEDNRQNLNLSYEESKKLETYLNELIKNLFLATIKFLFNSIKKFKTCLDEVCDSYSGKLKKNDKDYFLKLLENLNSIEFELDRQELRFNEMKGVKWNYPYLLGVFGYTSDIKKSLNENGMGNQTNVQVELNIDEYFNKNNYGNTLFIDNLLSFTYSFMQTVNIRKKLLNILFKSLNEIVKIYENFINNFNKMTKNLSSPKLSILTNCPYMIQFTDFLRSYIDITIKKKEDYLKFISINLYNPLESMIKDLNADDVAINQIFIKFQKEYMTYKTNLTKLLQTKEKVTLNLEKVKDNIQKNSEDPTSFSKLEKQFLSLRGEESNLNDSCLETFKKFRKYIEENMEIIKKIVLSYREKEGIKMRELKEIICVCIKTKEKYYSQISEFLEYRNQIGFDNNSIFNSIKNIYYNYSKEFDLGLDEKSISELINEILNNQNENESKREYQSILKDVVFLNKEELITKKEFSLQDFAGPEEMKGYTDKLSFLKSFSKKISLKNFNMNRKMHEDIFYLEEDESVLSNFSSALSDKILLQGKLYISNKKIVFYSWFNNSTLFGKTLLEIKKEDILEIDRHKNMLFDNMILVKTKTTSFLFASLVYREKCYYLMREVVFGESNPINNNLLNETAVKEEINSNHDKIIIAENKNEDINKDDAINSAAELKSNDGSEINSNSENNNKHSNYSDLKQNNILDSKINISFDLKSNISQESNASQIEVLKDQNKSQRIVIEENKENSVINITASKLFETDNINKNNFIDKIKDINKTNYELFSSSNKRNFQIFPAKNHKLGDLPLSNIFKSIYDPDNINEELGKNKNFMTSYLDIRQDYGYILTKILGDNWNSVIPNYIQNKNDYLFKFFENGENLNNLTSSISYHEIPKIEYKYNYTHPILKKKLMGPSKLEVEDIFKIYFISPICMIVEVFSYISGFMMMDTFYSVLQYKFESSLKYDESSDRIIYDNHLNISFGIEFIKDNWFKSKILAESQADMDECIKTIMLPIINKVVDGQKIKYLKSYENYLKIKDGVLVEEPMMKPEKINENITQFEMEKKDLEQEKELNEIKREKEITVNEIENKKEILVLSQKEDQIIEKYPQEQPSSDTFAEILNFFNAFSLSKRKYQNLLFIMFMLFISIFFFKFKIVMLIFINLLSLYIIFNKLESNENRLTVIEKSIESYRKK